MVVIMTPTGPVLTQPLQYRPGVSQLLSSGERRRRREGGGGGGGEGGGGRMGLFQMSPLTVSFGPGGGGGVEVALGCLRGLKC